MTVRIGILTERMLLGYGVDLVVDESARGLLQKGYDVVVFTTSVGEMYAKTDYEIVNLMHFAIHSRDIYSVLFFQDALDVLARKQIDVWIPQTPPFYHWLPHLRPPAVAVEHGTPPGSFFEKRVGRGLDAYTRERFETIYPQLGNGYRFVAISDYIRSEFPDTVRDRVTVIHNGADHYPRASQEEIERFRQRVGATPEDIIVLWVGRIQPESDNQPYKGLKEFMSLAPLLHQKFPNFKIVGAGKADDSARNLLQQVGIIPVFNLSKEEMPGAFAAADIFLNTSKWEGFNLPLAEAQFQGTPVVAYRLCSHPEVVCDGVSGILVDSPEELTEAVLNLARDTSIRNQMKAGALKQSECFRWSTNTDHLEHVILQAQEEARQFNESMLTPVDFRKNLSYYWKTIKYLIHREGFHALFRESIGWIKRRIPRY